MSKIAYLFGAGASYGTLPLVKEMPEWIDNLIKIISSPAYLLSDIERFTNSSLVQYKTKLGYQQELIEGLKWLKDASSKSISIDTYAKKLFIKQDFTNLRKLKILLSVYFVIEQIRHSPNPRYDFFFASIMSSLHKLPDDIRILSWNYDSQFEIAYSDYSNDNNIAHNEDILNMCARNRSIDSSNLGTFGIFKLNGSTEFRSSNIGESRTFYYNLNVFSSLTIQLFEQIVNNFATYTYAIELVPGFSFAWEPAYLQDYLNVLKEETKDTEILIVIGYSFPYFNRSVDKEIILNMKNVKRIHFQSTEAKQLIDRFKSIRNDLLPDQLIPESDIRYFFIPDELS